MKFRQLLGTVLLIAAASLTIGCDKKKTIEPNIPEVPNMPDSTMAGIEWVKIPAGTFEMGSPENEAERYEDEGQHSVTISKPYYLSKYPVTFAQYDLFCEKTGREKPYDNNYGRENRPVINVSWDDANAFAFWVGARLPTEAEWEYACRAGSSSPFYFGDCIDLNLANFNGTENYASCDSEAGPMKTLPVTTYAPNAWGLCDMHGNVWEWCVDFYAPYPTGSATDPAGPPAGTDRVTRGGSYIDSGADCRSAKRSHDPADSRIINIGFRLAHD